MPPIHRYPHILAATAMPPFLRTAPPLRARMAALNNVLGRAATAAVDDLRRDV